MNARFHVGSIGAENVGKRTHSFSIQVYLQLLEKGQTGHGSECCSDTEGTSCFWLKDFCTKDRNGYEMTMNDQTVAITAGDREKSNRRMHNLKLNRTPNIEMATVVFLTTLSFFRLPP